jgi:hypothetical protein
MLLLEILIGTVFPLLGISRQGEGRSARTGLAGPGYLDNPDLLKCNLIRLDFQPKCGVVFSGTGGGAALYQPRQIEKAYKVRKQFRPSWHS